jgi:Leucine-rich repeat (LRR) protein
MWIPQQIFVIILISRFSLACKKTLIRSPSSTCYQIKQCSKSEILTILKNFNESTVMIQMVENKIPKLEADFFANLSGIWSLDVSNNGIKEIVEQAFNGLLDLKDLSLENNGISMIFLKTFWKLKRLEKLDLSNNVIQFLVVGIFQENQELRKLYLNDNHIQILENHIFERNLKLEVIYLNRNRILAIGPKVFSELKIKRVELLKNSCIDGIIKDGTRISSFLHICFKLYQFQNFKFLDFE